MMCGTSQLLFIIRMLRATLMLLSGYTAVPHFLRGSCTYYCSEVRPLTHTHQLTTTVLPRGDTLFTYETEVSNRIAPRRLLHRH